MSGRTRSGFAAGVAVLLAGCSSSHDSAGIASVSILYGGTIVFQRPDGTVQESVTFDAAGTASARIVPGSLVTVARYFPGTTKMWSLTTIAGIAPGDTFQGEIPNSTYIGTGTFQYPGACGGASAYFVGIGCASSPPASDTGPVSLPIFDPTCGSTVDVLGIAWNCATGGVPAYATAYAVPVIAGSASAELGPWQPAGTTSITLTNLPADTSDVLVTAAPRRNGVLFNGIGGAPVYAPPASITIGIPYPVGFATSARETIGLDFPSSANAVVVVNDASYDPTTVDMSTLPPRLSNLHVAGSAGRVLATWDQAGVDRALDGTLVHASWRTGDGVRVWDALLPPGATSFAFPLLPADLAEFVPDGIASLATVENWDASDLASYADVKHRLVGFVEGGLQVPRAAKSGTIRSTTVQAP